MGSEKDEISKWGVVRALPESHCNLDVMSLFPGQRTNDQPSVGAELMHGVSGLTPE